MTATQTAGDRPIAAADAGSSLAVGECLAGRYALVRFIAAGGMGEVYEAEDRLLGARVAVKTIRRDIARDRRALARFRREVLLARMVTHRNVCRVFELAVEPRPGGEVPFLVMELLRGETLAARLARRGRMDPGEVLAIASQLAAGLDAAHDAGVLHRDFKAANVVLADRPVVTDFGLARPDDPDDPAGPGDGGTSGTPASMAPEQLEGRPTSPATDVYAFGLLLFEMLTGSSPFVGPVRRPDARAPAVCGRVPGLDPRWDAVLAGCLAVEPAARFARAGLALAALRERPGPRRRRWLAGAAAVGLLAAAGRLVALGEPAAADGPRKPATGVLDISERFDRGRHEYWEHASAADPVAARAALDRLREQPLRGDEEILYDMLEVEHASGLGDLRAVLAWSTRAANRARQRGSPQLALALEWQRGALRALGEPQRSQAVIAELQALQTAAHDVHGLMWTYGAVEEMARDRGELGEARRICDERLAFYQQARSSAARGVLDRIADIELRRGWLDEVERVLDELADRRSAQHPVDRAIHAMFEARLLAQRGALAEAEARFVAAVEIFREHTSHGWLAAGLLGLGGARELLGDLAGARASLEEARTIATTLGFRRELAEVQIVLARVALASGELEAADRLARAAEAELARQEARDGEALAACVVAAALRARGRADEAVAHLAAHLERGSEDAEVRTRLAIASGEPARIAAAARAAELADLVTLARLARAGP